MATKTANEKAIQALSPRFMLRMLIVYSLIPLLLFLCGRDLGWWQAWAFSVLIIAAGFGARLWAERRHPGLMAERERTTFKNAPGVKSWDKILSPLMGISISFPLVIVAGLDHFYGWSPAFPVWLNILGLVIIAGGYAFGSWAIIENRFFSGMVRIQSDRGHVVCDTGPYRFVRHPGYAGNALSLFGIVLALSSLWTLIPAVFALVVIIIRTALEDRTLQAELPGYQDYARRVRFRLFPGIF